MKKALGYVFVFALGALACWWFMHEPANGGDSDAPAPALASPDAPAITAVPAPDAGDSPVTIHVDAHGLSSITLNRTADGGLPMPAKVFANAGSVEDAGSTRAAPVLAYHGQFGSVTELRIGAGVQVSVVSVTPPPDASTQTATIRGRIHWGGAIPRVPALPGSTNCEPHKAWDGQHTLSSDDIRVRNGLLADALVSLVSPGNPGAPPSDDVPAKLALSDCELTPHVQLSSSARVELTNDSAQPRDLEGLGFQGPVPDDQAAGSWRFVRTIPHGSPVLVENAFRESILEVRDKHDPWLRAWVVRRGRDPIVLTAADGAFEFTGIKPGLFGVNARHLGPPSQGGISVQVARPAIFDLDITLR